MPYFFFQQLLSQGLNGIDRTNLMDGIKTISFAILAVGFLVGMYQSVLRGGDLRGLVTTGLKYLVVGIIIANWSVVFHQVNDSANDIAQHIAQSANAGDTFTVWLQQLKQQYSANGQASIADLVTESAASIISVLLLFCAYIIFPCAMVLFSLFYTLYGVLLYVVGPLILALLPMGGLGQMAKSFSVNLMVWNFWGILYAILGSLISVIHADQLDSILNQHGFLGFFQGLGNSTLLGLISIFYALALALIPFIAKRVVGGEVGETMFTFMRAATTAAGLAVAGIAGPESAAGNMANAEGGGAGGSGSVASANSSSSVPPVASSAGTAANSAVGGTMNSNSAPGVAKAATSAAGTNSSTQPSETGAVSNAASSAKGPLASYRPQGVAQFLAYHGTRAAAKAAQSFAREHGDESEGKK